LARYVIDERWTVHKAIKFENRSITGLTNIDELVLLCRARGGRVVVTHDAGQVTVRLIIEIV
jgi:hypothetical protein